MPKTTKQIVHAVHSWTETDFDQRWYLEEEVKELFARLEKEFEKRIWNRAVSQLEVEDALKKIKYEFLGNGAQP